MPASGRSPASTLWLQLLLVGAMASVAILAVQIVRQAQMTRELSARLMHEYGAVAAWSYREHVTAELRAAADELLGSVNHGDGMHQFPPVPPADLLGHAIAWDPSCECHAPRRGPLPVRFFAFELGSDTAAVAVNYSLSKGWLGDPIPGAPKSARPLTLDAKQRRWLNARLTAATRETPRTKWGYLATVVSDGDSSRMFVSRPMATSWGDTVIYALEYDRQAMESLFGGVLKRGMLLPPSILGERNNADVIAIEVARADSGLIERVGTMPDGSASGTAWLGPEYGGIRIRAGIQPGMQETLFMGDAPSSRVPLLLVMLVLALALTIVAAVQLRREVRFSAERSRFVANVSHELRTPLTQVRLVLDTVRLGRERDEEMRRSALEIADREVLRLQHLVEGLLRFTRGPRGDDTPMVEFDIALEAKRVVDEFAPLAAPHDVRITMQGAESAKARMRPGALRQVLLNLLDNAVKYGRDGGSVEVDVSTAPGEGPRLTVTDQGPGVPQAERRGIFEPFERGAHAHARGVGGSGIGLTIVREIAEAHGGSVRVEDGPSGGARFVFQLPRGTA